MSLVTLQWLAGGAALFVGRDLNFLFSACMAAFIGLRMTNLLPSGLPPWADIAFVVVLAVIAAGLTMISKDVGFYVSGFLAGGFVANEMFAPGVNTIPFLFFIIGAILFSFLLGLTQDWGMIVVTCLIGVYLIYGVMPLFGTAKTLASGGLFVIGAIAQVVFFQMQKHSER